MQIGRVVPLWNEAWRLQDCSWLSHRWGVLLPQSLQLKYRLLALQEPLMRLELVGDWVAPSEPSTKNPNSPSLKPSANS